MRLIRGMEDAQKLLMRHKPLEMDRPSPSVQKKLKEVFGKDLTPEQVVARILEDVRSRGDTAIRRYTRLFDGADIEVLEVPREEWVKAYKGIPRRLREALVQSAKRVRAFHEASKPKTWVNLEEGYGELFNPLERVGIYVPGGSAAYPSTVIMSAVPARVAGVKEVIIASPARNGAGPSPFVLAAAHLAGVDKVFQIGGAQAIGALAYGTESVPKVDMVCGPGNIFVTLAKRRVYGDVAIDGLYGPTETIVIADAFASPAMCAADLLAQAEHDSMASPIFITNTQKLIPRVERELQRQLERLPRRAVAKASLEDRGYIILTGSLEEAVKLANLYAPEHLCLLVSDPWRLLERVHHAGGVFLGSLSPEVMGDYVAGPSHTMPTGGTARFSSPLGVHHFLKVSSIIAMRREHVNKLGWAVSTLARAEGFVGHARAVELRRRLVKTRGVPKAGEGERD